MDALGNVINKTLSWNVRKSSFIITGFYVAFIKAVNHYWKKIEKKYHSIPIKLQLM